MAATTEVGNEFKNYNILVISNYKTSFEKNRMIMSLSQFDKYNDRLWMN